VPCQHQSFGTSTWAASFEYRLASSSRPGCTSHTPRAIEPSAGLLRCSVRSVIGTEQAELVSALRGADAACNATPIVVGAGLHAAGCLNRRGHCRKYSRAILTMPVADYADRARLTAQKRDGRKAVTATSAAQES